MHISRHLQPTGPKPCADQRKAEPGPQVKRDTADGRLAGPWIREADILETHAVVGLRTGRCREWEPHDQAKLLAWAGLLP